MFNSLSMFIAVVLVGSFTVLFAMLAFCHPTQALLDEINRGASKGTSGPDTEDRRAYGVGSPLRADLRTPVEQSSLALKRLTFQDCDANQPHQLKHHVEIYRSTWEMVL